MNELVEAKKSEAMEIASSMFGEASGISMSDITIGRLAVMQSGSVLVKDEKARAGQVINLLTSDVVGDRKTPFEIIPIRSLKYWIVKRGDDFVERFPAKSPNELAWEEGDLTRVYHHSFYVLLPSDVKEGMAIPLEIAFRSTDLQTAKKLSTFIMKGWMKRLATWGKVYNIEIVERAKDKNKWFGTDATVGRDSTIEEREASTMWNEILTKANESEIKHTSDEQSTSTPVSESVDTSSGQF